MSSHPPPSEKGDFLGVLGRESSITPNICKEMGGRVFVFKFWSSIGVKLGSYQSQTMFVMVLFTSDVGFKHISCMVI